MHLGLSLPASEVSQILWVDGELCVRLSAASVQGGHLSHVSLVCQQAVVKGEGDLSGALGTLASADCHLDGQPWRELPLPSQWVTPVVLALGFRNGTEVVIKATGLRCEVGPLARFQESLAC